MDIDVTDATWGREVLARPGVVVVEVHAPDSGPCEAFTPTVRRLTVDRTGSLAVRRLDRRSNRRTADRYRVTSLPTLLVFRDGRLVGRLVGTRQSHRLLQDLAALLR